MSWTSCVRLVELPDAFTERLAVSNGPVPCTLQARMDGHAVSLFNSALFQALLRDGFHHFDVELVNLRDGTGDDLLDNAICSC